MKRDQKLMITFEARCSTTAMGIMPHRDVEQALELALSWIPRQREISLF